MNDINHSDYTITWVGLLVIEDRKILMTKEKGKNLFQLPGGGQEANESLEDTLRREVREELCVEIANPVLYDDFVLPGRHENTTIRFIVYQAEVLGQIKTGEEIEELRMIDSGYEKEGIDIGNPTKLRLIPRLLDEGLIY